MTYSERGTKLIPSDIFRAYDIRGIFNKDITPETALQIGKGFGTYLGGRGKNVVVGRDVRLSGEVLGDALIRGLTSTGCNVLDVGVVPTPVLSFSVVRYGKDGGVMVSASHNPPEWNGFKLYKKGGGNCAQGTGMEEVKEIIFSQKFSISSKWKVDKYGKVFADYTKFLEDKVEIRRPLRVAMDPANGACGLIAPELFNKYGCEVVSINLKPDGRFPAHLPEPTEETLKDLMKLVPDEKADFGVGYDGDGDRSVFVDNKGRIVPPDTTLIIFAYYYLEKHKNAKIVFDITCSSSVEEAIAAKGGVPVLSRVGRTFLVQKMAAEKAAFGGESSGHFYFAETYGFDDGIFSSLKMAEILSKNDKQLSAIVDAIKRYPSIPLIDFDCPDKEKFKVVEKLEKEFRAEGYETIDIDGVKVILSDGWFLIRPSNTMPQIKMTAEAKSEARLKKIVQFATERLEKELGRLK